MYYAKFFNDKTGKIGPTLGPYSTLILIQSELKTIDPVYRNNYKHIAHINAKNMWVLDDRTEWTDIDMYGEEK